MSKNNMEIRLNFQGGQNQQKRMNADKLKSLKKALLYSYQAATAILENGQEFRCLINPNKISTDLDNKILSIPFKDVCLNAERVGTTTQGEVDIPVSEGSVIEWKENGSHWLVYLRRLEETAYFRAEIRRCRHQIELENGSKYWAYVSGPAEKNIAWSQVNGNYMNSLNNTIQIYIPQNEETLKFFHRFTKIKIQNKNWEVQAVDSISMPGIIEAFLKEDHSNTPKEDIEQAVENSIDIIEIPTQEGEYIHGPIKVYPYESHLYELRNSNLQNGQWQIVNSSRKDTAKIINSSASQVELIITTGKSATFDLQYQADERVITLSIEVGSF